MSQRQLRSNSLNSTSENIANAEGIKDSYSLSTFDDSLTDILKANSHALSEQLASMKNEICAVLREEISHLRSVIVEQASTIDAMKEQLNNQALKIEQLETNKSSDTGIPTVKTADITASAWETQNLQSMLKSNLREIMLEQEREEKEKAEKKGNLVIFHVKEPVSGDNTARAESDKKEIIELISTLDIQAEQVIESVKRLGKSGDKTRPILIKFSDLSKRSEILKKAKELRNLDPNHKFKNVYIKQDLTRAEMSKEKQLYEELKKARLANPNKTCFVRNGKIVVKNF